MIEVSSSMHAWVLHLKQSGGARFRIPRILNGGALRSTSYKLLLDVKRSFQGSVYALKS